MTQPTVTNIFVAREFGRTSVYQKYKDQESLRRALLLGVAENSDQAKRDWAIETGRRLAVPVTFVDSDLVREVLWRKGANTLNRSRK